jgi:hypothetical protein
VQLLRVSFGEAGADIIAANLRNQGVYGKPSATINPLISGTRVYAIIGFCSIPHFEKGMTDRAR